MDAEEQDRRRQDQVAHWASEDLVLFAVVGLRRVSGGLRSGVASAFIKGGRDPVRVVMSQEVRFAARDGGSVAITSHRKDDDERYRLTRSWAPMNPYLASPRGKAASATWDRSDPVPRPPEDLEWAPVSIVVDGEETRFEVCDLGDGFWAAVGQVSGVVISIDGRGVPLSSVRLERLTDRASPPPTPPDLGESGPTLFQALDERFERVPFKRVRGRSDYWALRAVEADHALNLAHRHHLSSEQSEALESYWLERIDAQLAAKLDNLDESHHMAMQRSRIASHVGSGFAFQLWFNTLGPGAKTWFGNRYVGIRHYTFRIRWRP